MSASSDYFLLTACNSEEFLPGLCKKSMGEKVLWSKNNNNNNNKRENNTDSVIKVNVPLQIEYLPEGICFALQFNVEKKRFIQNFWNSWNNQRNERQNNCRIFFLYIQFISCRPEQFYLFFVLKGILYKQLKYSKTQ